MMGDGSGREDGLVDPGNQSCCMVQHYRPLTKWIWGKTEARGGERGEEDGGGRVGGRSVVWEAWAAHQGGGRGAGAAAQFRPGEGPPGSWPVDVTGLSMLP